MPFHDFEIADGRPIELYEFQIGSQFVRVTSAAAPQTAAGNEYSVLPIKRTDPAQSKDSRSGEITLQVPSDFSVVLDFRSIIPYDMPSLTIFRFHQQDPTSVITFWKGFVSSVAMMDQVSEIACQPVDRVFSRQIPRFVYSGVCNHVLYDNGCLVNKDSFSHSSTVTSISADGITLLIAGLRAKAAALVPGLSSQELDLFWQGGYIEKVGAITDRRMVLQGDVGGEPNTVRILLPFRQLQAGDEVTVYAGCDHSIATCDAKFDNALRFGGYPYVPTTNPFNIDIDSGV